VNQTCHACLKWHYVFSYLTMTVDLLKTCCEWMRICIQCVIIFDAYAISCYKIFIHRSLKLNSKASFEYNIITSICEVEPHEVGYIMFTINAKMRKMRSCCVATVLLFTCFCKRSNALYMKQRLIVSTF
jgi:hypothetical protein